VLAIVLLWIRLVFTCDTDAIVLPRLMSKEETVASKKEYIYK